MSINYTEIFRNTSNVLYNNFDYYTNHIQEFIQDTEIETLKSKTDPRSYKVSFEKIKNSLNFETKKSVKDSVGEILKEVKSGNLNPRDSEFTNMSKLTEKIHQLNNYQFDENL